MSALPKNELFEAQLLRALGYAAYGAADVGECLTTVDRVRGPSLDGWHDQWRATAERVLRSGESSLAAGDRVGARSAFFRASNYFRTCGVFAMGAPLDPRLTAAHSAEVAAFRRGAQLLAVPPEVIAIPYQDGSLPGYFFQVAADDVPRPTLILTNGYDGTSEELYFCNGAAALGRGYNVLTFDGPGQGSALIDDGLVFRPDWENVITPVVDFALALSGIDPSRIALMGLSFGGYLAPRAATNEHRLAACVSDCGPYDLFRATESRLPNVLARQLPNGNPLLLGVLDRLARSVMSKPTAGWALRRNLMVHGVGSPLEYFRLAPQYSLIGREVDIQCPTFVCRTDTDELGAFAPEFFAALHCPKKYVEFKAADGAGGHCEAGARTSFHQEVFAWLDEVLAVEAAYEAA